MEQLPSKIYEGHSDSSNTRCCDTGANMYPATGNGETALHSAVWRRDEQEVRNLIKTGVNVDGKDVGGNTALIMAAGLGAVNIVYVLEEANCYLDQGNTAGETALLVACHERQSTCTNVLIDLGASVNKADISGRTPLMAAAQAGCSESVKHLINAPANLDLRNRAGMTALMMASIRDDTKCLNFLLAAGADADFKDNEGFTPLMLASREGKLKCVKSLLLDLHGVNKNAVNKDGMSALMLAASEGQSDCLRTLMLAGCDANLKDTYGNTALILATIHNKLGCVIFLSSHWADINAQNNEGMTALMFATPDSHQAVLQQLLMAGARTDLKNAKGKTALMIASKFDRFNAVKSLTDSIADIDVCDNNGNTALLLAAGKGSVLSLEFLILKGANLEHGNVGDETAIMVAAKHGSALCLDVLLSKHAEINHQSKETGMTALMLAAEHDHVSCLKLLIQEGANLELQNQESKTALMISIEKGRYNRFSDLLEAGASVRATNQDGQTPLMLAAAVPDTLYVWRLLQAVHAIGQYTGVFVNTKDRHSNTALMIAAEKGLNANVEVLIQHGAEVNMVNDKGESPMVLASLAGHRGCVRILVQNRAWFMNDENGQKALMKAVVLGQTDIVEVLIDAGGNVNLPDKHGGTPLLWAAELRRTDSVELLLRRGAYVDYTDLDGNTAVMITAASDTLDTYSLRRYLGLESFESLIEPFNEVHDKATQCLRMLIEACADINKVNNEGRTAIMLAAMSDRSGAATHLGILLANGAYTDLQDHNGYTALMHAVESSSDDECVLALLRAHANVDTQDEKGQNALMLAQSYTHLEYLLTAHADVNLTNSKGQTALMAVAGKRRLLCLPSNSYESLFSSLTSSISGIDTQDNQGETALMKASSAGNEDHVKALLRNGASVHLQDPNGRTALVHSILSDQPDEEDIEDGLLDTDEISSNIAKLLVDHGSNVNVQDKNGVTPLMIASSKRMGKMVQTLLDCGADVKVQDQAGKNALTHVIDRNRLRENFGYGGLSFEENVYASITEKLVNHGLDVNTNDENGTTALMMASSKGRMKIVQTLLNCGADVNLQDGKGRSALMHALIQNQLNEEDSDDESEQYMPYYYIRIVDYLIDHDADVNMKDVDGRTALMHAARYKRCDPYGVISRLARNKSSIDSYDNEGKSALVHALENCDSDETFQAVIMLLTEDAFPQLKVTNASFLNSPYLLRFLKYILDYFDDEYEDASRAIIRLLVSNGVVMPAMQVLYLWNSRESNDKEEWSPLLQACEILIADLHIAKYLIANCYLSTADMGRIRSHDLPDSLETDVEDFLNKAFAKPWPLVKLAQIAVSTAIGPSPGREERIRQTGLPRPIMDCLMFDRPIALLHEDWEDIPMCFDSRQYALQPFPYPLLHNWPFGHNVVPCDCTVCNNKDKNLKFTKIFNS